MKALSARRERTKNARNARWPAAELGGSVAALSHAPSTMTLPFLPGKRRPSANRRCSFSISLLFIAASNVACASNRQPAEEKRRVYSPGLGRLSPLQADKARGQDRLACTPKVGLDEDPQAFHVDGNTFKLEYPDHFVDAWGIHLVAHPYTDHSVLVSFGSAERAGIRIENPRLWEVPCRSPERVRLFDHNEAADFGHSVSLGQTIILTYGGAVATLDLRTKQYAKLIPRRSYREPQGLCWDAGSFTDVVVGKLSNGDIEIERGGECGFEHDWTSQSLLLRDPLRSARLYRESPVRTVVVGAAGDVWVGDAAPAEGPARLATPGAVWRSTNNGESWKKVDIPGMECAAVSMYADATRVGRVLVIEDDCSSGSSDSCETGCGAFATANGGRNWRRIEHQEAAERVGIGARWRALAPVDGDLQRLRFIGQAYSDDEHGDPVVYEFKTDDQGRTWSERRLEHGGAGDGVAHWEKPPEQRRAKHKSTTFIATRDGVRREHEGEAKIVFRTTEALRERGWFVHWDVNRGIYITRKP